MESVDSVVLAVMTAAVADSAAGDDCNVAVFANEKVVINALFVVLSAFSFQDHPLQAPSFLEYAQPQP